MGVSRKVRVPRPLWALVAVALAGSATAVVGMVVTQLMALGPGNEVCVEARGLGFPQGSAGEPLAAGVRDGGAVVTRLCDRTADAAQQWAFAGTRMPWYVFGFVAVVLLTLLLRALSQHGPFAAQVASWARTLGLFLSVGGLATAYLQGVSASLLADSMTTVTGANLFGLKEFPWFIVITGLAVLLVVQILRLGTEMNEDLDGVV